MSAGEAPEWLTQWQYAHRGLHREGVPENSVAGAQAAIAAGLGIECDIQRCMDGTLIVFHDWDLNRLAGKSEEVGELRAKDLNQISLCGTDQTPVELSRFLHLVNGRVPILIEIKSCPDYNVRLTCELISVILQSYDGQFAVMSFDPNVTIWFRKYCPNICCGLVMREDDKGYTRTRLSRQAAFYKAVPDFLAYHVAALPNPWVGLLRAGGLPILAWTVNSYETRARALANADALIAEGQGLG